MKRFVIRNYGPSRQFHIENMQIPIGHEAAIETDDEKIASFFLELPKKERVCVTDRGKEVTLQGLPSEQREAQADNDDSTDETEELTYDDLTLPELKAIAKDRNLNISGKKKAEIIELLEAYDVEIVQETVTAE